MDLKIAQPAPLYAVNKVPLVLAVDDDEDSLLLLACVLESLGCAFMTVSTAGEALKLAKEYPPDLLLLDIVLPDVNGMELLSLLKQDERTRKIAAIAVTGLARDRERKQIQRAGFNDYICKPYLIRDLEGLLYRYLSEKLSVGQELDPQP